MGDLEAELGGEPLGNQGAVARLRVALDAEERRRPGRELGGDRTEIDRVEDLPH